MKQKSEYVRSERGGDTLFTVTPAPAPKFIYLGVIGAIAVVMGLPMLPLGIVLIGIGGLAIWAAFIRDMRPPEHRGTSVIIVGPDRIEAAGRTFKAEDIHRLLIRNAVTGQEGDVTIVNPSVSVAAGMGYRAKVAQIANALTLEGGGKATVLAGGMDEVTAYGLLRDVSRAIGFERAA
ncbi:hypothetical protein GGQ61_000628 [Phenylobacterium haematophilum]|jgi:hypothetical protein|uniref:Uncharacterized protein n=1 Tax=Phenylobacterium haematophilum TaxID=98513 RepID=A0A839ZX38_9CAUL|nr:hypothetical protein [Phenylobacterium haematophilum]MBB3889931.1 hypothetical protein [Phenylobacterium haematophilum]